MLAQQYFAASREESGLNTLIVLDTRERGLAARNSLSSRKGNATIARMSAPGRMEGATADPAMLRSLESEPAATGQSPEIAPVLGVSFLNGVARESGVRLSSPLPAANDYKRMSCLLPLMWGMIGFSNCIPGPAWQKFLVSVLNVQPADQALLGGVVGGLPWNLKIFIAFLSDVVPIFGRRRAPYLVLGMLCQASAWLTLGLYGDSLTFPMLCVFQFVSVFGQMTSGVMCDTLIVENVRFEAESGSPVGLLQSNCWLCISIGGLVGGLLSGWLPQYLNIPILTMFLINAVFKFGLVVLALFMKDPKFERTGRFAASVGATWGSIWQTMTLLRVLRPLIFIMVFSMTPSAGAAFNSYIIQHTPLCKWSAVNATGQCLSDVNLKTGEANPAYAEYCAQYVDAHSCDSTWGGLGFSESVFAYIGIIGGLGGSLGIFLFKTCFIDSNWHGLFASIVCIATASSALQLFLMFRNDAGKTLSEQAHIPDVVFALGDDVVMAVSNQLLSMPILILMARLCPEGAEGTTYALVTSIQMVGGTVSGVLSLLATRGYGVTNFDFSRLWELVLLTSLLKLVSILFLPFVPRDMEGDQSDKRHPASGLFICSCFIGGLSWALYQIIASVL